MKRSALRSLTTAALGTALALLLGYVESLFPLPVPIPGVKLGLANVVVLCLLLRGEYKTAAAVAFVRVALSAALFSGFSGFVYALSGSLLSYAVMALLLQIPRLGTVGVSALGAAAHMTGQLLVAVAVTRTPQMFAYGPVLLLCGLASGILTGIAASAVSSRLPAQKS